jgi:hypothetical protein
LAPGSTNLSMAASGLNGKWTSGFGTAERRHHLVDGCEHRRRRAAARSWIKHFTKEKNS